mmetsp:Transcript_48000/g.150637  ORF Transcript_48000/g.150637 Transcript_48000/m.150637 type:complete len:239 (-) Transcript_48000:525-1241(-)
MSRGPAAASVRPPSPLPSTLGPGLPQLEDFRLRQLQLFLSSLQLELDAVDLRPQLDGRFLRILRLSDPQHQRLHKLDELHEFELSTPVLVDLCDDPLQVLVRHGKSALLDGNLDLLHVKCTALVRVEEVEGLAEEHHLARRDLDAPVLVQLPACDHAPPLAQRVPSFHLRRPDDTPVDDVAREPEDDRAALLASVHVDRVVVEAEGGALVLNGATPLGEAMREDLISIVLSSYRPPHP